MRSPRLESPIERIEHQDSLPLRAFVHSVRSCASHHHRECEFLLCLRGDVMVQTAVGETVLRPDDLFFLHPHELHLTRGITADNLLVALQIDPAMATRLDPEFPRRRFAFNSEVRRAKDEPRQKLVRAILAEILWELRLRRPGHRLLAESHTLRLLGSLLREVPSTLAASYRPEEDRAESEALGPRLERIIAHIETHSTEELTAPALASSERVSSSYLARLFKERLGTTFASYLEKVRLRQSLPLLAADNATVLELALACGFPNVKSYNQAFRRVHGTTPTDWKKKQMGTAVPGLGGSAYAVADTGLAYALLKRHLPPDSTLRT